MKKLVYLTMFCMILLGYPVFAAPDLDCVVVEGCTGSYADYT